ncbi:MAG: hypothetical protein R2932_23050 [Caldilineaceae bacterium]
MVRTRAGSHANFIDGIDCSNAAGDGWPAQIIVGTEVEQPAASIVTQPSIADSMVRIWVNNHLGAQPTQLF